MSRDRVLQLCQGFVLAALFFIGAQALPSAWMVVPAGLAAGAISGVLLPYLFRRKSSGGQGERAVGASGEPGPGAGARADEDRFGGAGAHRYDPSATGP